MRNYGSEILKTNRKLWRTESWRSGVKTEGALGVMDRAEDLWWIGLLENFILN